MILRPVIIIFGMIITEILGSSMVYAASFDIKQLDPHSVQIEQEQPKSVPSSTQSAVGSAMPPLPANASPQDRALAQILHCLNNTIPQQNQQAQSKQMPVVGMLLSLDPKGNITTVELDPESQNNFKQIPGFRPVVFNTVTAIQKCSPIRDLPASDYAHWKHLHLHLNTLSLQH